MNCQQQEQKQDGKKYYTIVIERKSLTTFVCILLAVLLIALTIVSVCKEKYNIDPTVKVVFDGGEYKELTSAEMQNFIQKLGSNFSLENQKFAWLLKYTGVEYVPEIFVTAEGVDLIANQCEHDWRWYTYCKNSDITEKKPLIEKGIYILSMRYNGVYVNEGADLKYKGFTKEVVVIIH